jgi:putative membrane protein
MLEFLLHLVLTAISIYLANVIVPGVKLVPGWTILNLLLISLIFGLLNSIVKPILLFISAPLLIVTLGLFYFVVNAIILGVTAALFRSLTVSGLWAAVLGSLVITVFNWGLSMIFGID